MLNDATDWIALIDAFHCELPPFRLPTGPPSKRATAVAWELWLGNLCRGNITAQPPGGPDSLRTIADALSRIVESYGLPEGVLIYDADDTTMTDRPMNLTKPTVWLPHNNREEMPSNTWRDDDGIDEAELTGNIAETKDEVARPASDDAAPKSKRADSPSRRKASAAYNYAMERIPDANAMTARELFDAILKDGEAAQMLPPSAATFTKYLNECGIRLRKSGPKAAGGSVVRWSDL